MPCSDGYSQRDIAADYSRRIDLNARVACNALTALEAALREPLKITRPVFGLTNETLEWWEDHKQADKLRLEREEAQRERERIKAQALAKLSVEERKALNL